MQAVSGKRCINIPGFRWQQYSAGAEAKRVFIDIIYLDSAFVIFL